MNDNTTLPVKFEWTDDLVFEYANTVLNDHAAGRRPMNVENFVRLKEQSYQQPDTIEVNNLWVDEVVFGVNPVNPTYHFDLKNSFIPQHKFPAIKQAIENVLNGEMDKSEIKDNQIYLLKEGIECVHDYLDGLNIPRKEDHVGTYSLVGRIKKLRIQWLQELSKLESEILLSRPPEKSLNTINKEEKTKEQVVTDNSDVALSCQEIYNQAIVHAIDVIQDMCNRLKEGDPIENMKYVNLLDAAVTLLINLKK